MATRISAAARNAAVNAVTALLNAGGPGYIEIRTGTQPATVATAATGTLLGTLTLSATAFAAASTGVAAANPITGDSAADATGTAGWFRAYSGAGTAVIDGDITATSGGGDMEMTVTAITVGGTLDIASWTLTAPASE